MTDGPIPLQRNGSGDLEPVVAQPFQEVNDDFAADLVAGDFAAAATQAPETRRGSVPLIHFAGVDIQVGPFLRQRCGWCGAVLVDEDLTLVAAPIGQDPRPPTWPVNSLVAVDGPVSWQVEAGPGEAGSKLPPGTCAHIDPSATL